VPRLHWVTVSRHVLHCSLVSFVDILYTKVVPSFSFSAGPPCFLLRFPYSRTFFYFSHSRPSLSFALLERNGRDNPEPSESCTFFYFHHPRLSSFFCVSDKKWEAQPRIFRNFLPSFTYQHTHPLLSLVFLERNGDGQPPIF